MSVDMMHLEKFRYFPSPWGGGGENFIQEVGTKQKIEPFLCIKFSIEKNFYHRKEKNYTAEQVNNKIEQNKVTIKVKKINYEAFIATQ